MLLREHDEVVLQWLVSRRERTWPSVTGRSRSGRCGDGGDPTPVARR